MWMSMTGFGRGDHHGGEGSVTAEVRSVNHRFLDIHVRCLAKFTSWEMRVRSLVRVNHGLLSSFLAEAKRVREEYSLAMDLSFRDLIEIPDLFVFAPEGNDPAEEHWTLAEGAVRAALALLAGAGRGGEGGGGEGGGGGGGGGARPAGAGRGGPRREEGKRLRAVIERSVRTLA